MNGLGFMVWQLAAMPPVAELIPLLKAADCRWISIKVANGNVKYNVKGGNDKPLLAFIGALKDAGIEVGGWHYVYPEFPGPQGDLAEERREKLGLAHLLVDAEVEWKNFDGAARAAKTYLGKLHVGNFTVGFCSYRYPSYHPLPYGAFLGHEATDIITPQVYWEGAHNPAEQCERSRVEYAGLSAKPFIPIGSAYANKQQDGSVWEPTVKDLVAFRQYCRGKGFQAYGFYSLDWIIQKNRMDWLEAIAGWPIVTPPPPPDPLPVGEGGLRFRVMVPTLNIRSGPGTSYPDIGDLHEGDVLTATDVAGDAAWIMIGDEKFACVELGDKRYLEAITPSPTTTEETAAVIIEEAGHES